VLALKRRVAADPAVAGVIAAKVDELLEPAVRTVVPTDRKLPIVDPRDVPEPLRVNGLELRDFALSSLAKRLLASDVPAQVVQRIRRDAEALYELLWTEYETKHGVRHPVRFYQEGLVTAPAL